MNIKAKATKVRNAMYRKAGMETAKTIVRASAIPVLTAAVATAIVVAAKKN
jgi:hypothetical protein